MKLYEILTLANTEYVAFIIGTSCETPIKFKQKISKDLNKKGIKGKVLFDMLMHSGNGDERFLEAYFDGEEFDDYSFEFIKIKRNSDTRIMTANYFKKYPEIIEFSILNNFQKKLLLKGCGI